MACSPNPVALPSPRMRLRVNGSEREVDGSMTVRALVESLGLGGALVAVERNRVIVPRARHAETSLHDGDEIEIVHFVGGG
jgi:thiamine biosynthesis protein ThiS